MNRHKNLKHIIDDELEGYGDYYDEEYYEEDYNPNVHSAGFTIDEYAEKTLHTEVITKHKPNKNKQQPKKPNKKNEKKKEEVKTVQPEVKPVQTNQATQQQQKSKKNKKKNKNKNKDKDDTEECKKIIEDEKQGDVRYYDSINYYLLDVEYIIPDKSL